MSSPSPDSRPESKIPAPAAVEVEPSASPRSVIPTGTIFTVLLESLNRGSSAAVLEALVHTLDKQRERLAGQSPESASERAELALLVELLRSAATQTERELASVRTRLQELEQREAQQGVASQLAQATTAIGSRLEERMSALFERERKRQRVAERRIWLGLFVLLLLLTTLAVFAAGWYFGQRASAPHAAGSRLPVSTSGPASFPASSPASPDAALVLDVSLNT